MHIELRPPGAHGALWRALAVFRVVSWMFVAIQVVRSFHRYAHPVGAVIVLAAMAAWTVLVCAATAGGARAPRRDDVGILAVGKQADFAVIAAPSYVHLAYRPGVALVSATWKSAY